MGIEFQQWPKIARLFRDCVITEKIDGTNAAIGIGLIADLTNDAPGVTYPDAQAIAVHTDDGDFYLYAQSRKQIIWPDKDNFGFAAWVWENAEVLIDVLGPGLHFGEWWGSGIQRGYGLPKGEKRFSLFNTSRFADTDFSAVPGLGLVPVLYEGLFTTSWVREAEDLLKYNGSQAAPGFLRPEGVIVFHKASNHMWKVTIEGDEAPKSVAVAA